jgi:hypothetical protein
LVPLGNWRHWPSIWTLIMVVPVLPFALMKKVRK